MSMRIQSLLGVVLLVIIGAARSAAASECPRDLQRLLTVQRCFRGDNPISHSDNDCTAAARRTVESDPSILPCAVTLDTAASVHHPALRRLKAMNYFDGKLKCSFDSPAPLNSTDWMKHFVLKCKEETNNTVWFVGGALALFGLFRLCWSCTPN